MQPVSINSGRFLPRMRLLNSLSVLADLSPDESFVHNLGPKCRSKCLPKVTELYLEVEKSDCFKLYLELCSSKILQILLGHSLYLTLYIRIQMSCKRLFIKFGSLLLTVHHSQASFLLHAEFTCSEKFNLESIVTPKSLKVSAVLISTLFMRIPPLALSEPVVSVR